MPYVYHEMILAHAKRPQNRGHLVSPTFVGRATNASCGDALEISAQVGKAGVVERCMFDGIGCALSQASASLMTGALVGKPLEEILAMTPEDVVSWLGIDPGPMRARCAALPLLAFQQGAILWKRD